MTITLTVEGRETLDNGQPARIALDRHGAMIGRSPHADWSLPDPRNLVSARHCEISFRDGAYLLSDHSTNGTFLNGASQRLEAPHRLRDGDRIAIGHYAILVSTSEAAEQAGQPAATGWDDAPATPLQPLPDDGWAQPPMHRPEGWASAAADVVTAPARAASAWDLPAPVTPPSAWSSAPPQPRAPSAEDVWGRLSEESEIDWSRGDFAALRPVEEGWQAPAVEPAAQHTPKREMPSPAPAGEWQAFLAASHLPPERLRRSPAESLTSAGVLLRQLVSGLMLMIEARARAKAQLGVQATGLELDGNNPLKFIRSPERALLQLLDTPESGFMPADRAVEDAFQDLQAHQMATLGAMRAALEGTLARISPATIREATATPRGLGRWFSVFRRARRWDAFEQAFEGVVRGADEAFMDLFAKEFRQHYDRHIAEMKARHRPGQQG